MKILKIKMKFKICIILILIILFVLAISLSSVLIKNRDKKIKNEQLSNFLWESKLFTLNDDYSYTFHGVVTIQEPNGIESVKYVKNGKEIVLNTNGREKVGIDYDAKEDVEYEFKITPVGKAEKTEILKAERKFSGEDTYELRNGIYVNTPNLENFNEKYTRYLTVKNSDVLNPANWIYNDEPNEWYDYKNQKWANIYVEAEGVESYYVWIPRYVYKLDEENQRTDVKFVDVHNNYKDPINGDITEYNNLLAEGYRLPEAFEWGSNELTSLSGYWVSKYQLRELSEFNLDYNMSAGPGEIYLSNFRNKVADSAKSYTYAINGDVVNTVTELAEYTFTGLTEGDTYIVNVTALDENDSIICSMTKVIEPTEVNPPELSGFDPDTTFYVYWDDDGNEHNERPISSNNSPENWYNYTYSNWANIVTRNNGLETYYVWIPRYQYRLNNTSERSSVKFIMGTGTETENGYSIPEAFEFGGQQLTGYWMTKYQLSIEESIPNIDAEMSAGSSIIRVRDITGTKVTEGLIYEYYLNGVKKHEGENEKENYAFEGLTANTTYTVNIIARNKSTNAYVGAVTRKVKTVEANAPDISKFDQDTTFYVTYDSSGNETRTSIKNAAPSNWYNYSKREWANVVTTANNTTSYWVWVPRYEFRVLTDRENLSTDNRRIEVNFLSGTDTNTTPGYSIPEAFEFGGQQLTGYWMAKYQLSE